MENDKQFHCPAFVMLSIEEWPERDEPMIEAWNERV